MVNDVTRTDDEINPKQSVNNQPPPEDTLEEDTPADNKQVTHPVLQDNSDAQVIDDDEDELNDEFYNVKIDVKNSSLHSGIIKSENQSNDLNYDVKLPNIDAQLNVSSYQSYERELENEAEEKVFDKEAEANTELDIKPSTSHNRPTYGLSEHSHLRDYIFSCNTNRIARCSNQFQQRGHFPNNSRYNRGNVPSNSNERGFNPRFPHARPFNRNFSSGHGRPQHSSDNQRLTDGSSTARDSRPDDRGRGQSMSNYRGNRDRGFQPNQYPQGGRYFDRRPRRPFDNHKYPRGRHGHNPYVNEELVKQQVKELEDEEAALLL